MGYDSESKEYHNDVAIIPGNVLAEGERDKIIQNPTPTANTNKPNVNQPELEAEKSDTPDPKPTNTIPFPSELHPTNKPEEATMEEEDTLPQLGQGHHVQKKPPGASQCMAEARPPLLVSVAALDRDLSNSAGNIATIPTLIGRLTWASQVFSFGLWHCLGLKWKYYPIVPFYYKNSHALAGILWTCKLLLSDVFLQ